jgi:hypothetical protein
LGSAAEYKNTGWNWKGLLPAEVREFRSVDIYYSAILQFTKAM